MRKTAESGLFLAVALVLSYVESLIPFSFGIPGIKLGLPNLIVVLLLYRGEARRAVVVNFLRILLSGFLFGNLFAIFYAMAGAVCSFSAMAVGKRAGCFSIAGVSVLGGVFHNIGQIVVAMAVVETYYMPFLIVAGTGTGAVLGIVAMELLPYLQNAVGSEKR